MKLFKVQGAGPEAFCGHAGLLIESWSVHPAGSERSLLVNRCGWSCC